MDSLSSFAFSTMDFEHSCRNSWNEESRLPKRQADGSVTISIAKRVLQLIGFAKYSLSYDCFRSKFKRWTKFCVRCCNFPSVTENPKSLDWKSSFLISSKKDPCAITEVSLSNRRRKRDLSVFLNFANTSGLHMRSLFYRKRFEPEKRDVSNLKFVCY